MLKTTGSTRFTANPEKTEDKAGGNSMFGNSIVGGDKATNSIKRKNQAKTTKSKILVKSKNRDFLFKSRSKEAGTSFFILEARLAFIQLRQAFIKALILYHFHLKSHIQIETNASSYAIGSNLSQLSSRTRPDGVVIKTNLGY